MERPTDQQPGRPDGRPGHSMWWMILCCLLPILLVGALYLWPVARGFVPFLMLLLCPLLHVLLMRGMGHGDQR
ncbi:MAG: DUF2933 domain-containing protein [Betaproteobacteria bacterium]